MPLKPTLFFVICSGILGHGALAQDSALRTWLWAHNGLPRNAALRSQLDALGFTGIAVEPSEDVSRLGELGIPWYVDQVVSGGVLALKRPAWDAAVKRAFDPKAPDLARPFCLHDPKVIENTHKQIAERLKRLAPHGPAFVSLRDEPSFTRLLNPMDWCRAKAAGPAFQDFLTRRFGSEEDVCRALGWDKAEHPTASWMPVTTDRGRRAFFYGTPARHALVPWHESRAFADHTFASALQELTLGARAAAPGVPIGFLGGQMPHAFGGFDWEQLLPTAGVVEVYDYGGGHDVVRSLKDPSTLQLRTVVLNPKQPAIAAASRVWDAYIEGDDELVIYSSAQALQEDGSGPTPAGKKLARHLKTIRSRALKPWKTGRRLPARVAIMCSMPSIRMHWMLDAKSDGLGWVKRLTSHEIHHSTQARNRVSWIALLEDLGIRFRFVTPNQIADGILQREELRALILPRTIAMSAKERERIAAFVAAGGLLVADHQIGLFTDHLERSDAPALDDVFGITRRDRRSSLDGERILTPPKGRVPYPVAEPGLRAAGADARHTDDEIPTVLSGSPGGTAQGRTVYLNLLVHEYADHRLRDPLRAAWLRDVLRPAFLHAGIRPFVRIVPADGAPPWPIHASLRRVGDDTWLALRLNVNNGTVETPWKDIAKRPSVQVRAVLGGVWKARDMVSGLELGSGAEFAVEVQADRPRIIRLQR